MAQESEVVVKFVPTTLQVDLVDGEQPIVVQYVVEITTAAFVGAVGNGSTVLADSTTKRLIEELRSHIEEQICQNTGIRPETNTLSNSITQYDDEDL